MSCPLKDNCQSCRTTEFLQCDILKKWFLAQQESSVRSHTSKLVEQSITDKINRRRV